jgi:hypothetical protein
LAEDAGVPAAVIGHVGGQRIRIAIDDNVAIDETLAETEALWANAIGRFLDRPRAVA